MEQPKDIKVNWWKVPKSKDGYVALNWLEEEIHIGYGFTEKMAYMKAADLLRALANECAAKAGGL